MEDLLSEAINNMEGRTKKDYYIRIRVSKRLVELLRTYCKEKETKVSKIITTAIFKYLKDEYIKEVLGKE